MTDELIRTLADKLNIAVDGATNWLGSAIPQYCQTKAFGSAYVSVVFAIIFLCCAAVFVFSLRKAKKEMSESYWYDMEWTIPIVTFGVAAVFAFLLFISCLADYLSWTFYPDGMLLTSLLK